MRGYVKYIISEYKGKVVEKKELVKVLKKFYVNEEKINFLLGYGYLMRILRGLYYVKTPDELELKKSINTSKLLFLGMEKLKVNWYFGLYTALKLNGLTHEYFDTTFIINNKIFRPKEIKVNGEKVKFIKFKPALFSFGTIKKDLLKFSDPEKTILDFIYLSNYRSFSKERTVLFVEEYRKKVNKKRIKEYLKLYPESVKLVLEDAGFI